MYCVRSVLLCNIVFVVCCCTCGVLLSLVMIFISSPQMFLGLVLLFESPRRTNEPFIAPTISQCAGRCSWGMFAIILIIGDGGGAFIITKLLLQLLQQQ